MPVPVWHSLKTRCIHPRRIVRALLEHSKNWSHSLNISSIFCICFLRRFACLAPARLIFYAIGWTSTWCCDGRLAKPAQSGAAPLVCCSAVIRQEYQTSESNSGIFRSPPPCWTTPLPPADQVAPSSSYFLHPGPILGGFILPSWRQDAHQDAKLCEKIGFKPLLNPSWTHLAPNIAQHRHQDGTTTPFQTPKTRQNHQKT